MSRTSAVLASSQAVAAGSIVFTNHSFGVHERLANPVTRAAPCVHLVKS